MLKKSDDMQLLTQTTAWWLTMRTTAWRPPTDIFETDDEFIVRVEIAGMREDNFLIELNARTLIIRGLRQDISERRAYHQVEIRYGEFMIEIDLPAPIVAQSVEADYVAGFLQIRLPKARPKLIVGKNEP